MSEPFAQDPEALRVKVLGLAVACPFTQGNPHECPLASLRERPLRERSAWVDALSAMQLVSVVKYHEGCLRLREAFAPRHS